MLLLTLKYNLKSFTRILPLLSYPTVNQKRFYPLSSLLKTKTLQRMPNVIFCTPSINCIGPSQRMINIKNALKRKEVSDLALGQKVFKTLYASADGFVSYTNKSQIVSGISGIYQPPPTLYTNKDNDVLFLLSKQIHKFVFTIFSGPLITDKQDLLLRIPRMLDTCNNTDSIFYYPIAQHIITNVFAHFKVPLSLLENLTDNVIDYSAYVNFDMAPLSIVEAVNFKYTVLNLFSKEKITTRIVAQNPDDLKHPKEYKEASYKQSKQPNMDLRLELTYKIETEKNKIIFLDSKNITDPVKTLSLTKGYLSLSTKIDLLFLIKRFKADIIGTAKQKVVLDFEFQKVKGYALRLEKIITDKTLDLLQKEMAYNSIKIEMLQDLNITCIVPSDIQVPKINEIYNEYSLNHNGEYLYMVSYIQKLLLSENTYLKLLPLQGNGQKADLDAWHSLLLKIIKHTPKNQKMLENYNKFKLIEAGYDIF